MIAAEARFVSFQAMRMAHSRLLLSLGDSFGKLTDEMIESVEDFLDCAVCTGAILHDPEVRADAQSLVNYWVSVLSLRDICFRTLLLLPFDQQAAAEQAGRRSPYRGLEAFQEEDQNLFFGRRALVNEMIERLKQHRLLAVMGISGSGKSSLVRAGLLSALRQGALPGSEDWNYPSPFVPGADPIGALEKTLQVTGAGNDAGAAARQLSVSGKPSVVVVDQFEELFTITKDDATRTRFAAILLKIAQTESPPHRVVLTMRSEYDSFLERTPELKTLVEAGRVSVPPLSEADLQKAIEEPAAQRGVSVQPGLIRELAHQVLGQPAGLPLLQFTLLKLWENRDHTETAITTQSYTNLGGSPKEILRRTADDTFHSLRLKEDEDATKLIFQQLVQIEAGSEATSRRVRRRDLHQLNVASDRVDLLLELWRKAGLLRVTPGPTRAEDSVEVMHEALIRNWQALVDWAAELRETYRRRYLFRAKAQEWKRGAAESFLPADQIREAEKYDDLDEVEREFLRRSHRQNQRQFQVLGLAMLMAFALLAYAGWKTYQVSSSAQKQQDLLTLLKMEQEGRAAIIERRVRDKQAELVSLEAEVKKITAQLEKAKRDSSYNYDRALKVENQAKQAIERVANIRPALLITNGRFAKPTSDWPALETRRRQIEANIPSVGRLELRGNLVATAFVVAPGIVVTTSYVFDAAQSTSYFAVDFRDAPDGEASEKFRVIQKVEVIASSATLGDLALLRIEPRNPAGKGAPEPLLIEPNPMLVTGRAIYTIGYPMLDERTPKELKSLLFSDGPVGAKRLMPGYLLSDDVSRGKIRGILHDSFSSGGAGGGPLIDLETGRVIGVHVAGQTASATSPGVKSAAPLTREVLRKFTAQ